MNPILRQLTGGDRRSIAASPRVVQDYLGPYKRQLIALAESARQQEVRWHLAHLLPRLPLNIAAEDAGLRDAIVNRLEELSRTGTPAMRSRGRKLLVRLKRAD